VQLKNLNAITTSSARKLVLPLPFCFGTNVIYDVYLTPDRDGPHEERTVVTPPTGMTLHHLKKKEKANFIMPTLRSGQI
jgi:hypothetical protein